MNKESDIPPAKRIRIGNDEGTKNDETKDKKYGEDEVDFTKDSITNDEFVMSDEKCANFVSPEELERLKEFKVLDEVKSNDEDSDRESHSSDEKSDEIAEEDVEKMLDDALPDEYKVPTQPREKPYTTRQKIILEEKGVNQLEVLPLDWVMVRHYSGMPVYIHRPSRVCTLARPYFLGKGNTRRHDIPISAIPCLAYRKALEEETEQNKIDEQIQEQIRTGSWKNDLAPNASCTNGSESIPTGSLGDGVSKKSVCPFSKKVNGTQNGDNDCNEIDSKVDSRVEPSHNDKNIDINNVDLNRKGMNEEKCQTVDQELTNDVKEEPSDSHDTHSNTEGVDCNGSENQVGGGEKVPLSRKPIVLPGGIVMAPPRVESVDSSWKNQLLNQKQVNDYCSKLFKFKTINIMHFKSWGERHKYTKARKALQYPTLPEGTKFITIPPPPGNENGCRGAGRARVLSVSGRSCLSVFHEYVRRVLDAQPEYHFHQLENSSSPYQATVLIGGMQYGVGTGSSKRLAKAAAARASMRILIPEVGDQLDAEPQQTKEPDLSFFEEMGVEDERVQRVCAASGEPSPYAVLRTCLHRNFGAADHHVQVEVKKLECQKIEVRMTVGKHSATAVANNMKTAKQRASQTILQALHPHVKSWGSLLRLYGSRSLTSCKQKKLEEQQITLLQEKARRHRPNTAVLDKLRSEMIKLRERDEALVPIGTILVTDQLPTHSGSNLNNVDL